MVEGYKVICNTAAGRRRYMQYLIPFVVSCEVVDRYDIWINTMDKQDIEFFELLAKSFPKIRLVYQPDGIISGIASINAFYRDCIEEDAIYFKLDDDIIWMEPDTIEKMVRFRIDNPDFFLVSPMIINNAICTYILQRSNKLTLNGYYRARASERILWRNGEFSAQLHTWFIDKKLKPNTYKELYSGKHPIAINRFSINAILWFGREMRKFDGIVPGDDEEWLSVIKPTELGLANCFNGDALIAHFAFYTQRKQLDALNILDQYGDILREEWEKETPIGKIHKVVQEVLLDVEARKENILLNPDRYKVVKVKKSWSQRITRLLLLSGLKKNVKYILD